MVTKKSGLNLQALAKLQTQANAQVVTTGPLNTLDTSFPIFETPVNEDKLVYIPMTNTEVTENGTIMKLLTGHVHTCIDGRAYPKIRCINGLVDEEFGLDGTCPLCDAIVRAKQLRNIKFESECRAEGIDPQNDATGKSKEIYKRLCQEMPVGEPVETVAFPIVEIETEKGSLNPVKDGKLTAKWVVMTKDKYDKVITGALSAMIAKPSSPAGMFWAFQFTYKADDGKHNKRDSGKNARYAPIVDPASVQLLEVLKAACEDAAKEFTIEKAFTTIVQFIPQSVEDTQKDADRIMRKTDDFLAVYNNSTAQQITAGATPAAIGTTASVQNALENFGNTPVGDIGVSASPNGTFTM